MSEGKTEEQTKFEAKVEKNKQAYTMTCAELGQAVYRLQVLAWETDAAEKHISALKSRLKEINEKAHKYSQAGASDTDEAPNEAQS